MMKAQELMVLNYLQLMPTGNPNQRGCCQEEKDQGGNGSQSTQAHIMLGN
jgi:hypothetical protein